jgi:hypothetical protein
MPFHSFHFRSPLVCQLQPLTPPPSLSLSHSSLFFVVRFCCVQLQSRSSSSFLHQNSNVHRQTFAAPSPPHSSSSSVLFYTLFPVLSALLPLFTSFAVRRSSASSSSSSSSPSNTRTSQVRLSICAHKSNGARRRTLAARASLPSSLPFLPSPCAFDAIRLVCLIKRSCRTQNKFPVGISFFAATSFVSFQFRALHFFISIRAKPNPCGRVQKQKQTERIQYETFHFHNLHSMSRNKSISLQIRLFLILSFTSSLNFALNYFLIHSRPDRSSSP